MALLPLVEGHAEVSSIPVLLRRLEVPVLKPFRVKRRKVVKPGELERSIQTAILSREGVTSLLLLLDADDDLPCELAPSLLKSSAATTHVPSAVVIANRELEAWFLGGIESLRGFRGIAIDATWGGDPEGPRDAKGRLSNFMIGRTYLGIDDQPALMDRLAIELTGQRCPSFAKFLREVSRLTAPSG